MPLLFAVSFLHIAAALSPGPSPAETLDELTKSYANSPLAPPNYEAVSFTSSAKSPSLALPEYESVGSDAPAPGLNSMLSTLLAHANCYLRLNYAGLSST
jgi:hypothetical protein